MISGYFTALMVSIFAGMQITLQFTEQFRQRTWLLFGTLTVLFIILYFADKNSYLELINEDSLVEWLTFAGLLNAAGLAAVTSQEIRKKHGYYHWFFILFCCFNLLAAFEEINLHDTFQGIFHIKTKHIALLALFTYGVILPWLNRRKPLKMLEKYQVIIPPSFLTLPFLLGTVLMLDFQTGREEEIGEFFFSICFVTMALWYYKLAVRTNLLASRPK